MNKNPTLNWETQSSIQGQALQDVVRTLGALSGGPCAVLAICATTDAYTSLGNGVFCGAPTGCSPTRAASAGVSFTHVSPPACEALCETCAFRSNFCLSCDATKETFLTDNACHSSDTHPGKCKVFATDGGFGACNVGFYGTGRRPTRSAGPVSGATGSLRAVRAIS